MALSSTVVTLGQGLVEGKYNTSSYGGGAPALASTIITNQAAITTLQNTVAANVATLVADGASPTQAHVNTLNTNYGLLNSALTAQTALLATLISGNMVVTIDTAVITSQNALKAAIKELLLSITGSATLTP